MADWLSSLLSPLLQVLFDRDARSEIINFFTNQLDDKLLEKLKMLFLSANSVLIDAEEKQFIDPHVREWLDKLKEAAYDADDILVETAMKAAKKRMHSQNGNRMNQVIDYASLNPFADRVKPKVEKIIETLIILIEQKDFLGLTEGSIGKTLPATLTTTSLVNCDEIHGRRADMRRIKGFLLSENANGRQVTVVSIVGMAGIGKTTLAQLLYNNAEVKECFDLRSWAYVAGGLNVLETTMKIYESVTCSHSDITDLNVLQLQLKKKVEGRRCLLILDDYCNENVLDWDILTRPFESADRTRIIITTRSQFVTSTVDADLIHSLSSLSPNASWELFSSHAFTSIEQDVEFPILVEIGREIVERCGGLPLALKTLGCLLHSQRQVKEWDMISNSKIWELPNDRSIFPALILSYNNLPALLKRCFAYCSIIPKGCEIEKQKLIYLWMAEGIIPEPNSTDKRREDVGDECFQQLLSRSFLLKSHQKYMMHDLFNELAQCVAGKFCCNPEDINPRKFSVKPRHVSYKQSRFDTPDKFATLRKYQKHIRTLLPFRSASGNHSIASVIFNDLKEMKNLRVLSLSHYGITKLPELKKLKLLRYLDLSGTAINQLPHSVVTLYNLETLLLSGCSRLNVLPEDMSELINLRHLDITGCNLKKMPAQFGKLTDLQVLTYFVASQENGATISELRELSQLRGSLSILKLENVANARDALGARLENKRFIHELELRWTGTCNLHVQSDVLGRLRPHAKLERLKIQGFGGDRLPSWLGSSIFSRMVFLCLSDCQSCSSLPPLGQLPSLKRLNILRMNGLREVGPEFCGTSARPFRCLELLKFEDMLSWEVWSPSNAGEFVEFASLQVLHIHRCPILGGNLNQMPLSKLVISESPVLENLLT